MLMRPILHRKPSKYNSTVLCQMLWSTKNATRQFHDVFGDIPTPSQILGISYLRDPRYNKGLAHSLEERQTFGFHGLMPPIVRTQERQLQLCKLTFERYQRNLNKYLYLTDLAERNECLFYRLLSENIEAMMPIVYTPTVGQACQQFGLIYRHPRGLFVTINDRGHVFDILKNWPEPNVRAICVTDGERILGLGDLGACGMGIPVGKLSLYTALASIKPHWCLPLQIDVGTNNKTLLEDPLYIGLRQERVKGAKYDEFMDEFMKAVVKRYGTTTLIQFEDFGSVNAFKFLDRYKDKYCTFNDDIQGTAAVVLGGLYTALRITGKKFSENILFFAGAGQASCGIAKLCMRAMVFEGLSIEDARKRIFLIDVHGVITKKRSPEGLLEKALTFAQDVEEEKDLAKLIQKYKPNILIGATATHGLFSAEVLKHMAANNERPIVFALSNPTSKAECTAEEAYKGTEGRVLFASGSPFAPVEFNGKKYFTSQGNNAYVFPGVALGVIASGAYHVPDKMFLTAAKTLADMVSKEDLESGLLYPPLKKIREVSFRIAIAVANIAYKKGLASDFPEAKDKTLWLKEKLYDFNYHSALPKLWKWEEPKVKIKVGKVNPAKLYQSEKE